jgi:hypothetical protein
MGLGLDAQTGAMRTGMVRLVVEDDQNIATGSLTAHEGIFFDAGNAQQPDGQVGVHLSDFFPFASLPAIFCRPSAAEQADGAFRFVLRSWSRDWRWINCRTGSPRLS